jgi:hypothetical protein
VFGCGLLQLIFYSAQRRRLRVLALHDASCKICKCGQYGRGNKERRKEGKNLFSLHVNIQARWSQPGGIGGVGNCPFASDAIDSEALVFGFRKEQMIAFCFYISWKIRKKQQTGWADDAWMMDGSSSPVDAFPWYLGAALAYLFMFFLATYYITV